MVDTRRPPVCAYCGPRVSANWRIDVIKDYSSLMIMCCTQCKATTLSLYRMGTTDYWGEKVVSVSVTAL